MIQYYAGEWKSRTPVSIILVLLCLYNQYNKIWEHFFYYCVHTFAYSAYMFELHYMRFYNHIVVTFPLLKTRLIISISNHYTSLFRRSFNPNFSGNPSKFLFRSVIKFPFPQYHHIFHNVLNLVYSLNYSFRCQPFFFWNIHTPSNLSILWFKILFFKDQAYNESTYAHWCPWFFIPFIRFLLFSLVLNIFSLLTYLFFILFSLFPALQHIFQPRQFIVNSIVLLLKFLLSSYLVCRVKEFVSWPKK